MELAFLKTLADLGIAAVITGCAIFGAYKIIMFVLHSSRQDIRDLFERHENERREWLNHSSESNKSFSEALEKNATATTHALEKLIREIQHVKNKN